MFRLESADTCRIAFYFRRKSFAFDCVHQFVHCAHLRAVKIECTGQITGDGLPPGRDTGRRRRIRFLFFFGREPDLSRKRMAEVWSKSFRARPCPPAPSRAEMTSARHALAQADGGCLAAGLAVPRIASQHSRTASLVNAGADRPVPTSVRAGSGGNRRRAHDRRTRHSRHRYWMKTVLRQTCPGWAPDRRAISRSV